MSSVSSARVFQGPVQLFKSLKSKCFLIFYNSSQPDEKSIQSQKRCQCSFILLSPCFTAGEPPSCGKKMSSFGLVHPRSVEGSIPTTWEAEILVPCLFINIKSLPSACWILGLGLVSKWHSSELWVPPIQVTWCDGERRGGHCKGGLSGTNSGPARLSLWISFPLRKKPVFPPLCCVSEMSRCMRLRVSPEEPLCLQFSV